jgi:hypothetical protein
MTVTLRSGPALLLAAGEATTFFGHPLAITLALPEGPYTVTIQFEARPENPDVAVDADAGPHGITLTLVNFDTDEGRGSREPVLLGGVGDDLLFLHFRAFRFGRSDDRTVHYSVYRASRAAVGWVSPS